jgi:hypothetical protein
LTQHRLFIAISGLLRSICRMALPFPASGVIHVMTAPSAAHKEHDHDLYDRQ